ncbi:MAG: hypothetical protein JJU00_15695 [Opitutales bacterium]|nr:hypothetical protein [Opitutales bacterium]
MKRFLSISLIAASVLPALLYSAQESLRYTIGVHEFENRSNFRGQINLAQSWGAVLTDALQQSGRFIVLGESEMRGAALMEQDLAASGRAAGGDRAPQTGQLTPAQLLVKGEITHLQTTGGGDGGVSVRGFSVGGGRSSAEINAIVYVVDSTTGQVKASKRVEGNSASTRARVGVRRSGVGADIGGFQNENLAEAVALAIEDAVAFIVSELDSVPWTADVVAVRGGQVYINRGEREGVSTGQNFVVGTVEELRDPGTGELLDIIMEEKARLEVAEVRERIAICKIIDGDPAAIERGSKVSLP